MIKLQPNIIQWYNENEGRSYPFAEHATRLDNNNQSIPDNLVVDFNILVPAACTDVYCTSIYLSNRVLGLSFASACAPLAIGTYVLDTIKPYTSYPLVSLVDNVTAWIVFGPFDRTQLLNMRFNGPAQSLIEQRAIRVIDKLPVTKLLRYGSATTLFLQKLVNMASDGTVKLYPHETNPRRIVVELDPAASKDLLGPCDEYADHNDCLAPPVRSINGVPATSDGKIRLVFEP